MHWINGLSGFHDLTRLYAERKHCRRNAKALYSGLALCEYNSWDIRLISSVPFFYVNKKTVALGIS